MLGPGGLVAAALFGFQLRQPGLNRRECLELLERDRDGLGLRGVAGGGAAGGVAAAAAATGVTGVVGISADMKITS